MIKNTDGLTAEESIIFIDVFEASLRIHLREHFFSWTQGSFQSLLPHEILLCGVRLNNVPQLHFESFVSTRYFTDHHLSLVTNHHDGLVSRVINAWKLNHRPIMLGDGLSANNFGGYQVPFEDIPSTLCEMELRNILAHGIATKEGDVSTFFSFSRIAGSLNARQAYILELLVPHMHAAFLRILDDHHGRKSVSKLNQIKLDNNVLTLRESEVLKWVYIGKTNPEISAILYISVNTVKNHVHSAISKLGVENRQQASAKAFKLGLY